jgi:hypothetical protein
VIRLADARELATLAHLLNTSISIEGRQLQPLPVPEARAVVSNLLAHLPEMADIDDYYFGEDPEGCHYTTLLGVLNTVLSFMVPGALIGTAPDGSIAFFVDDDRFFRTISDMRDNRGLIVDIKQ